MLDARLAQLQRYNVFWMPSAVRGINVQFHQLTGFLELNQLKKDKTYVGKFLNIRFPCSTN